MFARPAKAAEALEAGADVVGAEDLAEKVQAGDIQFDRCIATPDMMALVGRLGKILGPRGLMPNPKLGTVTMNVKDAVLAAKSGQVEFRAEKAGIIHAGVGKASFDEEKLVQNIRALVDAVQKAKPTGAKGTYLQKASLSSTMGPGIKLDVASLAGLTKFAGCPFAGGWRAGGAAAPPNLSEIARTSRRFKGLRPARRRRECQTPME